MNARHAIALDDESTWPLALVSVLANGLGTLTAFHREERRIDKLGETDLRVRFNPPGNPHKFQRELIIDEVERHLTGESLVAFHCTRLHENEIAEVMSSGLRVLSRDQVSSRIEARVLAGDLPATVGASLLAESLSTDENRSGMIWFVFTRQPLTEESGVWRLLSFWGGEAQYRAFEDDESVGPILRRLGTACIVEAAVPVSTINTFMRVAQRVVRFYISRHGVYDGHDPEWEGYVREPIPANGIRRILRRADDDFGKLTACASWHDAPT